jgi:hypothetical protein
MIEPKRTVRVTISQPMKNKSFDQIADRKDQLVKTGLELYASRCDLKVEELEVEITNDFSKYYADDYEGEKPARGVTLAWSLEKMAEADINIFDIEGQEIREDKTPKYPGCRIEYDFCKAYELNIEVIGA